MRRFVTLLILFFCSLSPVRAQERVFTCTGSKYADKELPALLGEVQKGYERLKSFKAEFVQSSYLAALDSSDLSSGRVIFSTPGRMRWDYVDPKPQVFVTDAETMWYYQPDEKQVLIDNFESAFRSDLPVSFLLGLGDLRRDFKPVSACKGEDGIILELERVSSPTRAEDDLRGFKLLVNFESKLLIGARIADIGGNVTAILFREFKQNPPLTSENFALDIPRGTDRIDRRREG